MTIVLTINDRSVPFESPLTIAALLGRLPIPSPSVAVAVNAEIVPRSEFETFTVKDGDQVDIVQAVGGG